MPTERFGEFTADGREYVISNPRTPRPWHNYLFNPVYLVNLTQHATGASFYQPTGEGLRANLTEDRDGNGGPRYVYLRDNEGGTHWSLTGAPSFAPMDEWACHIGLGYQINRSLANGIRTAWRIFVPQTMDPVEIWTLTIGNASARRRRISVFPYLEMHLTGGSTLMDFIAVIGGRFDQKVNAVFGVNSCVKFPKYFKAFLASDTPAAAATVSRDAFMGPYRDYHNPIAVTDGNVHNPEAGTEWLGASLRHDLTLEPGETRTINVLVGVVSETGDASRLTEDYLAKGKPESHFRAMDRAASERTARMTVETPDPRFDRWMNIWLKHQLHFVSLWGRVIGRGFRDILQDAFGHRLTDPDRARDCLKEVFAKQFPSGKCIRAWRLPIAILDLQDYADSPSWMIMALSFYLKETGDFALLEESVPFLNPDDPYAAPTSHATVWEHVVLAQRHLLGDLGAHGLSKIHYGDWCDTMNGVGAAGRGESVMLTMQVKWGCDLLAQLALRRHDRSLAAEMSSASKRLAAAVDEHAWDGAWYRRAFDDNGVPVGTSNPPPEDNGEGLIFMNPQSWALISETGTPDRQRKAVASALQHLDVGYGMVLNFPAYTGLKPRIGQMTAMSPGFYENGSVYVHGNCFWIYGLAKAGYTEEAFRALNAILPDTDNKPNTDTEPFVIPNYYIGPSVDRRKQRNLYLSGWRTGSAAWIFMTGIECLLGARADYDGLVVEPRLPTTWQRARIVRPFRGATYDIRIVRQTGANPGVVVDGTPLAGNVLPLFHDGRVHQVVVTIR